MAISWLGVWQTYGKYLTVLPIVLALIVIMTWPQKTGDVRTDDKGKKTIYWRGPDSAQPGEWLPQDESVLATTIVKKDKIVGTDLNNKTVTDFIAIGGGKAVIVLESGYGVRTAAIVGYD